MRLVNKSQLLGFFRVGTEVDVHASVPTKAVRIVRARTEVDMRVSVPTKVIGLIKGPTVWLLLLFIFI